MGVLTVILAGLMGGIGPLGFLKEKKLEKLPGNAEKYHIDQVKALPESPLAGKRILFLGSSVTYGACSLGTSMADYIGARDGCEVVKEAVSGTTLATAKKNSYVERLKKLDTKQSFDAVVVQLSTNDAMQKIAIGGPQEPSDTADYDTDTVCGAIMWIIRYCRQTWNCPVVFYTGTYYKSDRYQQMVDDLLTIRKSWDIGVIDLWNDQEMRAVSDRDYSLYMHDPIHPTQAGYLLWWTPKFEAYLDQYLGG